MISSKELVAEASGRITTIPVDQALGLLDDPRTLFVDLREATEVARDGRIPGALHVTRGMLEFVLDPATPYHQPALAEGRRIVFYCASGGRSALAADTAQRMGIRHVAHLGGGFKGWLSAGGPVLAGGMA